MNQSQEIFNELQEPQRLIGQKEHKETNLTTNPRYAPENLSIFQQRRNHVQNYCASLSQKPSTTDNLTRLPYPFQFGVQFIKEDPLHGALI